MRINFQKQENPSFGYYVGFDSGCSKALIGTGKPIILSNLMKPILKAEDIMDKSMLELAPKGFKNSQDYIDAVVLRIKQFIGLAKNRLASDDDKLEGVTIFAPCIPKNNTTTAIGGLRKITNPDECLTDIDFKKIDEELRKIFSVSDNYEFKVVNDMSGSAAAASKELKTNSEYGVNFNEGFSGWLCMTGGGTGLTRVQVRNGVVQLSATQKGHTKLFKNSRKMLTSSEYGGSVPGLISNYIKKLKMQGVKFSDEDTKKIINMGQAKVITDFPVAISKGDEFTQKLFKDAGLFYEIGVDNQNVYYQLEGVSKDAHKKASNFAVKRFMDSISFVVANEGGERIDAVALAGPLIKGIKEYVEKVSGRNFEEVLRDNIYSKMGERVALVAKSNDFKVVFVPGISDNTAGIDLILKGKAKDNWVDIPYDLL